MEVIDYNGKGRWTAEAIRSRYLTYAGHAGIQARELAPQEFGDQDRRWVYPVMHQIIEGIEAGDSACIRIGIEFVEEDEKFAFGKILKANTAKALRRASLSDVQKERIRVRVFGMLEAGHIPHEYREYAKLARKIGFTAGDLPWIKSSNPYVIRFFEYFRMVLRTDGNP